MSRRPFLLGVVLVALTVWIYAPVWNFDFVSYDDADFVTGNPGINSGFTKQTLHYVLTNPYYATGGPLTWLSHIVDLETYGLRPRGHHVSGLLWHVANVLLLFALLRRLTGATLASVVVAAVFAVHPLHVESVAWISQRKDVLSTFFWLLTLWAYQSYVRAPGAGRYLIVTLWFVAGLLSKPIVAMAPLTMLVLDAWPLARIDERQSAVSQWRRLIIEKIPFAALAAVAMYLTLQSQLDRGAVTEASASLSLRLANASLSYVAYLGKIFWPADLSPFYPYRWTVNGVAVAASALGLVAVTLLAIRVRRTAPAVAAGWAWYLATLIPVIGFVQVGAHAMADRLTYVPSIGISIALVWPVAALVNRKILAPAVGAVAAVAVIAAFSVTARTQVWHWQNGEALWRHAIAVDPGNARAFANLGATLAGEQRVHEALVYYRDALRLTPDEPKLIANYALALAATGDSQSALGQFQHAVNLDPRYIKARVGLADQLAATGRFEEAIQQYRLAMDLDQTSGLARMNLAVTLAERGRMDEALVAATAAIAIDGGHADWRFARAMMLKALGRKDEAARELEEVLRLDPGNQHARAELSALRR